MNKERGKEKRKEKRFTIELFPSSLKYWLIAYKNMGISVTVMDISFKGFSFHTPIPLADFKVGNKIYLYPLGKKMEILGEIVHSTNVDGVSIIGVKFSNSKELESYQNFLLNEIKKQL